MAFFSIIIPTLNRPKDLTYLFDNLLTLSTIPSEILVVDQSDDNKTHDLCVKSKYDSLSIRYFHTTIKSSSLARNIAINNLSIHSNYVVFLDDDVSLSSDFFEQIELFFQKHSHAQ